jgi:hypothetical protein
MSHVPGFHIFINGTPRSFHDVRESAIGMAQNLKFKNPGDVVTVKCTETGSVITVLPDGRLA